VISPRRSFLPSLHLLPPLHCKSRSSSWPLRATGGGDGGGARGKKRAKKRGNNQRWWDDWQNLRLVCKNWNVIATDPRLIVHIRRHQEVFFAQIAEQAKRYSGTTPPPALTTSRLLCVCVCVWCARSLALCAYAVRVVSMQRW
jgi:hypothetical protein